MGWIAPLRPACHRRGRAVAGPGAPAPGAILLDGAGWRPDGTRHMLREVTHPGSRGRCEQGPCARAGVHRLPAALALAIGVAIAGGGCRTRLIDLELLAVDPQSSDAFAPDALADRPVDLSSPIDLVAPFFCRPIYVVDFDTQMLSGFDPAALEFTDIGRLRCPGTVGDSPDAMSIDLAGNAWVLFVSGKLFQVDLRTAACHSTQFDPRNIQPDPSDQQVFGASFSLDRPGGTAETFYVATSRALRLVAVDPVTLVATVGPALPDYVELTGTPAAELWLFDPWASPSYIARVDKQTGVLDRRIDIPLITVTGDFTFASWGGVFWVFNGDGPNRGPNGSGDTSVYRIDPATGEATKVLAGTHRHIVGSGVSACAPPSLGG